MDNSQFFIDNFDKLPMFDLPVDFLVYDKIAADLLGFYKSYPCKIDACIFAYIADGCADASINLWDYKVKKGDLIVIIPGSFIQIKDVSPDISINIVGFSSKFLKSINFWKSLSQLVLPIFNKPVFCLSEKIANLFGDAMSLLSRTNEIDPSLITPKMMSSIVDIFMECLNESIKRELALHEKSHTSREHTIVTEFMQLAFENYRDEHKVSFYAHEVNLTLSHFCNVISKATGMTPQEIIMNMIIMDAKTQLKWTSATVTKIAASLGFNTPTTFNRYFRTYVGMTPQEYRNSKQ